MERGMQEAVVVVDVAAEEVRGVEDLAVVATEERLQLQRLKTQAISLPLGANEKICYLLCLRETSF